MKRLGSALAGIFRTRTRTPAERGVDVAALRQAGDVEGIVRALVCAASPDARRQATSALEAFGQDHARIAAAAVRHLGVADRIVRAHAADLLWDHAVPAVIPPLVTALDDSYEHVRLTAARALAATGSREVIAPLLDATARGRLEAWMAVDVFRRLKSDEVEGLVLARFAKGGSLEETWAEVLAGLRCVSAVPLLKAGLEQGRFTTNETVTRFVNQHPELHPARPQPEARQKCALCGAERPVSELRDAAPAAWFCRDRCWARRGTVLPTGVGHDCPRFAEGLCTVGHADLLCSLTSGSYEACFVYASQRAND